jgi:hypothetical protein
VRGRALRGHAIEGSGFRDLKNTFSWRGKQMSPVHSRVSFLIGLWLTAILAATSRAAADEYLAGDEEAAAAVQAAALAPAPKKAPPLPFHTIEGVGGGAITPMAYLVNPPGECDLFGKPAVAFSYVNLGRKNLDAFTITENFGERIEFGYAADRLSLGNLPMAIRDFTVGPAHPTGIDVDHSDLWLHNFNIRFLLLKENANDLKLPAVTAGVHFKYNDSIRDIDRRLGGALSGIGFARENGTDFTLTATKTIPKTLFERPLIVTAGMRESQAANLGFLGFSNTYHTSFEGNVAFLPFDKILVAYEFRQKTSPYDQIPGVINGEDNWHALDLSLIMSEHATLVAGYGVFGMLANSDANSAWWLQLKYEF